MGGNSENYVSIIGEAPDSLQLVIVKGGLQTDVVYKFMYRIKSIYGWSSGYSPTMSAITATLPLIVSSISFSIIDLLNIRVEWQ